jgi:hypothetical protein
VIQSAGSGSTSRATRRATARTSVTGSSGTASKSCDSEAGRGVRRLHQHLGRHAAQPIPSSTSRADVRAAPAPTAAHAELETGPDENQKPLQNRSSCGIYARFEAGGRLRAPSRQNIPLCRDFYGSDGTRTRDLRRDRPAVDGSVCCRSVARFVLAVVARLLGVGSTGKRRKESHGRGAGHHGPGHAGGDERRR